MLPTWIRPTSKETYLDIIVTPGASKDAIVGEFGERVKLQIKAPATEGKANEAILKFLASQLALPPKSLRVVRGMSSRRKTIGVAGDHNGLEIVQKMLN